MVQKYLLAIATVAALTLGSYTAGAQGMAINTTGAAANSSAILDVNSTTQGMLVPRMTTAQRTAITVGSAQTGLLVYQTDGTAGFYFYDGSAWVSLSGSGSSGGLGTGGGSHGMDTLFSLSATTTMQTWDLSGVTTKRLILLDQGLNSYFNLNQSQITITLPNASLFPAGTVIVVNMYRMNTNCGGTETQVYLKCNTGGSSIRGQASQVETTAGTVTTGYFEPSFQLISDGGAGISGSAGAWYVTE